MAGIPYASSALLGLPRRGSCPASQTPAQVERGCFWPFKSLPHIQPVPSRILMDALGATDGLRFFGRPAAPLAGGTSAAPVSARGRACRPTPPRAARTVQTSAAASRGPRRSSPVERWMRGQQGRLSRRKGYPRRLCARLNRCWAAPVRIRRQDPDFSAPDGHPASQQGGRLVHACRIQPSGLRGIAAARRGTDLYRPRGRPMPVAFANLPCTRGANLRLSIVQDKIMCRENLFPWIRPLLPAQCY